MSLSFKEYLKENRIVGPALINKNRKILVQGFVGQSHAEIYRAAIQEEKIPFDILSDAFLNDYQHVFIDSKGRILDRYKAAQVARRAGQIDKPVDQLQSDHLNSEYI